MIKPLLVLLFFITSFTQIEAQTTIRQLFEQRQWQKLLQQYPEDSISDAEGFLYRGIALARLNELEASEFSFLQGIRLDSSDKRLYQELAGVYFLQEKFRLAKSTMNRAYEIESADPYTNEFLGTLYYMERNTEAAVQHWNRVSKPKIVQIRTEPAVLLNFHLLDSAFAASPFGTLSYDELRATIHRLELLNTFSDFRLELEPVEAGNFDLVLRASSRSNPQNGIFPWLISTFRNVFSSTVRPEFYNINRNAINVVSMFRWDSENLRAAVNFSFPFGGSASKRLNFFADWRNEEWDLTQIAPGPLFEDEFLDLQRIQAGVRVNLRPHSRIGWSAAATISDTDLNGIPDELINSTLFQNGLVLRLDASSTIDVLRIPSRRMNLEFTLTGFASRSFADPSFAFGGVEGDLFWHWHPRARGDDYMFRARARLAKTFGDVPFAELYTLGAEADTDLWLRAHKGLQHERRGSNPMGADFVLINLEWDKIIMTGAFIQWKLTPFVDTGTINDRNALFGSENWLVDAGIQTTFSLPGNVDVNLSFARDLRSAESAIILHARSQF